MGDFSMEMQRIGLWCTVAQMVISSGENSFNAVEAADGVLAAFDEKFKQDNGKKENNV